MLSKFCLLHCRVINLLWNYLRIISQLWELRQFHLCVHHVIKVICSAELSNSKHNWTSKISCETILSKSPMIAYDDKERFWRLLYNTMTFDSVAGFKYFLDMNAKGPSSLTSKPKQMFNSSICICRKSCIVPVHSFSFDWIESLKMWLSPIMDHPTSKSSSITNSPINYTFTSTYYKSDEYI